MPKILDALTRGTLAGHVDLSLNTLREALNLRQQIDELEARLASLFTPSQTGAAEKRPQARRMSAAARARISAAAKARWAARRSGQSAPTPERKTKKTGGISAAGRKRLSEMMKARWAARKRQSQSGRRS